MLLLTIFSCWEHKTYIILVSRSATFWLKIMQGVHIVLLSFRHTHSFLTYRGTEENPAVPSSFTAPYIYKISDIFVDSVLHPLFSVLDLTENSQVTHFKLFTSFVLCINIMVTGSLILHTHFTHEKQVTVLIRWPFLTLLLSPGEYSSMNKKKWDLFKAILSNRKRASKLTNLNSIYQLSFLLLTHKNKSLQAVLNPVLKLLLCQYFPYSASQPPVLLSLNLFYHGVHRNWARGLMPICLFLISLSRQSGQATQKRWHHIFMFVPTQPGQSVSFSIYFSFQSFAGIPVSEWL